MYVELHARSVFSFLDGASSPEELVALCAELNIPAMALLDRDGVYGAPRFHMAAKKAGVKAHIGAEVSVVGGGGGVRGRPVSPSMTTTFPTTILATLRYALLAETREGYQNL